MRLADLVDPGDLARGIADGLIGARDADDGQRIFNYTDAALYTPGAWANPAVRQCRGLIVDPASEVVGRPWAKFFNHGQAEAGDLDLTASVEVTDKMDGSLGIIHLAEDGSTRVATRGSFQSEQALHASEWIEETTWRLRRADLTPLVEIIYPANRIVCDYGDRDELVLLGAVEIETGRYLGPGEAMFELDWPFGITKVFPHFTLRDALAAEPRPGAEGLCVRLLHESRIVKVKQEDYIRLHRIVSGLSRKSVWEAIGAGQSLDGILADLPDELHDWTRAVWSDLADATAEILAAAGEAHAAILRNLGTKFERRDYAGWAQRAGHLRPYLFLILDGRDPTPAIHKSLKPLGDTRARAFSEATA